MIAVLGGGVVMTGATLLYLASSNQQLTKSPPPRRWPLAWAGVLALAFGLALILQWAGPVASVFIAMTLAMLVWTVVPLAAAWWRAAPEGRQR
ncbi:MAG: hypothetical protein R3E09_06120 [Novosphingobium sp.]|nr:hypothetical protein [Novosphingobium sp.]